MSKNSIPDFIFPESLIEGVIVLKRYRFVVDVKIGDETHTCHCPCTGRVAPFDLKGRPCLLSRGKEDLNKWYVPFNGQKGKWVETDNYCSVYKEACSS